MEKEIICIKCHSKSKHHAKGMCKTCYLKHRYSIVGPKPYSEYNKQWRKENKERYLAAQKAYVRRIEEKLFIILGGPICVNCGFSDKRALHIAHKLHDGNNERKIFKTKDQLCAYYVKYPKKANRRLKILCANCNTIEQIDRSRKR